jgi:tetratricopeptide (TPR) repeat protein
MRLTAKPSKVAGSACALVLLLAAQARAASGVSQEAQEHFNAGVSFLQDPDGARYEEAYREFKAAYAASPSWKILGNLGIAAMKLERDGEAIAAFRKYLDEGKLELDAEERAQVQRDLSMLEASSAQVRLNLPAGASVLDERFPATGAAIQNSYGPGPDIRVGVRPGRHRFTAKLDGTSSASWEVELQPKDSKQHTFTFAADKVSEAPPVHADSTPNQGLRVASYAAFGVGAVGLTIGTIFGLKAKDRYQQGNALCPTSGTCTLSSVDAERRARLGKDGDNARTLSLVGFVAGGVGVAAGVTLLIVSGPKKQEAARISGYIGGNELGLMGSF